MRAELTKLEFSRLDNGKACEGSKVARKFAFEHHDRNASCRRRASGTVEHINTKPRRRPGSPEPIEPTDISYRWAFAQAS